MCENDDVGSLHHGQQMLGLWRLSVLRPLVEAARREVPAFYLMLRILAQLYALCIAHGCVVPANNTDGRSWGFILVLVIFSMAVASRRVPLWCIILRSEKTSLSPIHGVRRISMILIVTCFDALAPLVLVSFSRCSVLIYTDVALYLNVFLTH